MIIFLYGPDTYRSGQKLKEIIESRQKIHKSGLSLNYFEGKNFDYRDFKTALGAVSMFGGKKLLILKDVFSNTAFKENFLKEAKNFLNSSNIIVFYQKEEFPPKDKLVGFLKKYGKFQEFRKLEGEKLTVWIKREFAKYKTKIDSLAAEELAGLVGNDLWRLSNEIRKLTAYKQCKEVKKEDITLLVGSKIEADIFKTIDALAQKNKKTTLALLQKHLMAGHSPLYLLSMINFQFRNLLTIKNLEERGLSYSAILTASRLHPFVAKKSWWLARQFSLRELKKIYQKLFEADFKIKTGRIDPQTGLISLIAEI
jgi:DNA polymerase-3 subunit delta